MNRLAHRIKRGLRPSNHLFVVVGTATLIAALLMPAKMTITPQGTLSVELSVTRADTGFVDYETVAPLDDEGKLAGNQYVYAVVNKSGTCERNGVLQVRLDLCLAEGAYRYDDPRFYVVDTTSKEYLRGYKGKVDSEGIPLDQTAYDTWFESLPHVWLTERVFHTHFIYIDPLGKDIGSVEDAIAAAMAYHLPNFYAAWCEDYDQVSCGMRHGWAVESRVWPTDYSDAKDYTTRQDNAIAISDAISTLSFTSTDDITGETFPSTDIDVGTEATDRGGSNLISSDTTVGKTNPANDDGTIDTVEIWLSAAVDSSTNGGLWFGTFSASGNTLTCRDSEGVGTCSAGSKQTFTGLDIDVLSGDYLGLYNKGGDSASVEKDSSGGSGHWAKYGEYIDPTDSASFSSYSGTQFSMYGTGETASAEPIIINTPDNYTFGVVAANTTYNSTLNYFNVTNSGSVAVNITIGATDFVNATAGSDNWTLSDTATPATNVAGLKAGLSGDDFNIVIRKSETYNNLVTNLAASNSQLWGIKLYTPTEFTNGDPKQSTVTITAAAA